MARPREFDETQVVQEAMHVFWRQGYRATSVQDLVDATGIQRGSLYGAFGDKHGLFIDALDAYSDLMLRRIGGELAAADDPAAALRAFVRGAGVDSEDPALAARGCLIGNTCSELVEHDELARERVTRFLAKMRRVMADGLRRAQALGTFGADRDPEAVATFIQVSLQGLTLLARSQPGPDVLRGVVDEVLRVLD